MAFKHNQTVYLPDGREAVYFLQDGERHLVRILHELDDPEVGPYTYPEDKVTVAARVYATAPVEVWDKQILAKRAQVSELDRELTAKRQEVADAARNKAAMEKAAAKYPCIQQALDFIEGRITHVVRHDYGGGAEIQTLKEAFESVDTWGGRKTYEGMKLLNLFGTDAKGRAVAWGLNTYRDGSGGTTTQIWPARGEDEARQIVTDLFGKAVEAWRSGDPKFYAGNVGIQATLDKNPWLTAPDDWLAHMKARKAEERAKRIANLQAEIAKLEADE